MRARWDKTSTWSASYGSFISKPSLSTCCLESLKQENTRNHDCQNYTNPRPVFGLLLLDQPLLAVLAVVRRRQSCWRCWHSTRNQSSSMADGPLAQLEAGQEQVDFKVQVVGLHKFIVDPPFTAHFPTSALYAYDATLCDAKATVSAAPLAANARAGTLPASVCPHR